MKTPKYDKDIRDHIKVAKALKKLHWCSLIRDIDTEFAKKFDYQMRQDWTQR